MTDRGGYPCPSPGCPETFVVPSLLAQHLTDCPYRQESP